MPFSAELESDDPSDDVVISFSEKRRNITKILDSDSENETCEQSHNIEQKENKTLSDSERLEILSPEALPDNLDENDECEPQEANDFGQENVFSNETDKSKLKKKKDAPRKSMLNALEQIHSESQRLVRESRLSLPYHRPKQRSLADFLNRRKSLSLVPLKAAKEKLSQVWEQIEQRERMVEKLYNSDTDDSDNDESIQYVTEEKITHSDNGANNKSENNIDTKKFTSDSVRNEIFSEEMVINSSDNPQIQYQSSTSDIKFSGGTLKDCSNVDIDDHSLSKKSHIEVDLEEDLLSQDTIDNSKILKLSSCSDIFADSQNSESINESGHEKDNNDRTNFFKTKLNQISEKTLKTVPKISGFSDEVINLDENLAESGTVGLMKRFMKHISLKPDKALKKEEISILESEVNDKGDIIKLTEETVSVNVEKLEFPKLGEKLNTLKATLQQNMSKLREQQLAKRIQEFRFYEEEEVIGDKPDDDDDNVLGEEEFDMTESETEEEEEEEEEDLMKDKKQKQLKNPFVDEEAEVSDDDDDDAASNVHEEDEISEDDDIDLLKEDPSKVADSADVPVKDIQFEDGIENLLDLCSGNFTSQPLKLTDLEKSQSTEVDANVKVSNIFETSSEIDSDEELIVTKKYNKKKLYISDDEEDDDKSEKEKGVESNLENTNDKVDDADNEEPNDEDLNVESDHELDILSENEDIIEDEGIIEDEEDELARKISKGFLDGEAELSGSDWESADEDEQNLDDLESELGDEDRISDSKVQKELGKLHFKEMMAEDKREVRILQELLLEDGELHSDGPKRQRIFRWYNDGAEPLGPDKYVEGAEGEHLMVDDEDDETWRRTRTEREKYLKEKNIDNLEDLKNTLDTSVLNIGKSVRSAPIVTQQSISKSPDPKLQFRLVNKRGSFLNRGEKVLNKLAQISVNSVINENPIGSSKGKKSMVFAVVSPPKAAEKEDVENVKILKRKSENATLPPMKKLRFSSDFIVPKKLSLLEQLKQSDMTSK